MSLIDKQALLETNGKLTYIDDCYDKVIGVILTSSENVGRQWIVECDGSDDGIEKLYDHISEELYRTIGYHGSR